MLARIGIDFAIYFLFWWVAFFIALPFGLRTQADNHDVTLGTVASAPGRPHLLRSVLLATVIGTILFGSYLFVTRYVGLTLDDVPNFIPEFK
jgi:predicted secreted protein